MDRKAGGRYYEQERRRPVRQPLAPRQAGNDTLARGCNELRLEIDGGGRRAHSGTYRDLLPRDELQRGAGKGRCRPPSPVLRPGNVDLTATERVDEDARERERFILLEPFCLELERNRS